MVRIPTPIPSSTWTWLRRRATGRPLDILWAVFVTAVIITVAYYLVVMSPIIGGAIAGAALATLISERVRRAVRDIYRRDFKAIKL